MPTFEHPVQNANELRDAAQGLAHTTHRIDDPTCVYPVLCSLSSALESLSLSLHRLGELHDGPAPHGTGVDDDAAAIIVTAQRRQSDDYDERVPAVGLRRTADYAVQRVHIAGDTRDGATRLGSPSFFA